MSWAANENAPIDITDFQGLVGGHDDADLPEGAARTALNVRFDNGRVEPRLPLIHMDYYVKSHAGQPDAAGHAPWPKLLDFLTLEYGALLYLLYISDDGGMFIHLGTQAKQIGTAIVSTVRDLWATQMGSLLAVGRSLRLAGYDQPMSFDDGSAFLMDLDPVSGAGANWVFSVAPAIDGGYMEPLLPRTKTDLTPSTLKSGASGMDLGVHNFGIMFRTKLGTYTKPYSDPAWTVTITGTGEVVDFTFTPATDWPDEYAVGILILTPAGAPNSRYVMLDPGGPLEVFIPVGSVLPITFSGVDISDADLQLKPPDTDYSRLFRFLDTDTDSSRIAYGIPFGNRVAYLIATTATSSPADYGRNFVLVTTPGSLTTFYALESRLPIPADASVRGMFVLREVLWVDTNRGLYGFVDNGLNASQWTDPAHIGQSWSVLGRNSIVVDQRESIAFAYGDDGVRVFDGQQIAPEPIFRLTEDVPALSATRLTDVVLAVDDVRKQLVVHTRGVELFAYLLDYSRSLSNPRVSTVGFNSMFIQRVRFGPVKAYGADHASILEEPVYTLIFSWDQTLTAIADTPALMYLLPREMRLWSTFQGDDAIAVDSPFAVDYEIANLPGPKDGADRGAVREFVFTLVRMLVQNPLAANQTVNIELVRHTGNTVNTFSLEPYTPSVINAAATWLERGSKASGHRIGFRIHGQLVHGAFSLSRLMVYLQRRFA